MASSARLAWQVQVQLHDGTRKEVVLFGTEMKNVLVAVAKMNGIVIDVQPFKQNSMGFSMNRSQFIRSIIFHMDSGLSAGKALELVIQSQDSPQIRMRLEPALDALRLGGSTLFSDAMEASGMMDDVSMVMIRGGEEAARIKESLEGVIVHLEKKQGFWKKIIGALTWLSLDLFFAVTSVFGIQYQFLPLLEDQAKQNANMPASQLAEFTSAIHTAYILNGALLAGTMVFALALAATISAYYFDKSARRKIELFLSHIPVARDMLIGQAVSASFGIVAMMVGSGSKLNDAVNTALTGSSITLVKDYWTGASEKLSQGYSVGASLRNREILSHGEQMQLDAHQNTSHLVNVMSNISKSRAEMADRASNRFIPIVTWSSIIYSLISALIAMWVVWVQNKNITDSFSNLGGY